MSDKLTPGAVQAEHFDLLLLGTSIRGKGKEALRDYLVGGLSAKDACALHETHKSQFYLNVSLLNKEHARARLLAPFYPDKQDSTDAK